VIVAPPFDVGAVNAIDAEALPAVATKLVGALAILKVETTIGSDQGLVPSMVVCATRNW
jgi:hypothetical protein